MFSVKCLNLHDDLWSLLVLFNSFMMKISETHKFIFV